MVILFVTRFGLLNCLLIIRLINFLGTLLGLFRLAISLRITTRRRMARRLRTRFCNCLSLLRKMYLLFLHTFLTERSLLIRFLTLNLCVVSLL